jgi:large conductance mechanosensitive channel
MKEFKAFLLRGNLVDLAVAVVIGTAFGAVVASLVADLITPLIAAIFGKPNFDTLHFTINGSIFFYGHFLNAVFTFVTIGVAVFFFVVKPVGALQARHAKHQAATTRACPECLSEIPLEARRCAQCTSEVSPV